MRSAQFYTFGIHQDPICNYLDQSLSHCSLFLAQILQHHLLGAFLTVWEIANKQVFVPSQHRWNTIYIVTVYSLEVHGSIITDRSSFKRPSLLSKRKFLHSS